MWTMCSALPGAGIAVLVMLRANGWIIQADTPIETPVLVLALVAVVLGPVATHTDLGARAVIWARLWSLSDR